MLEILKKRRSIRKFKEVSVEKEKIEALIQAALLSPTSRNLYPWEFIIVTDKSLLQKLALSKEHGSTFLKDAPLGIVVLADPDKSDVWIEDTSIASILIQVTAESLGLGSCWIQIRQRQHNESQTSEEYVREVLNIPQNMKIESIIAVGYPDEQRPAHTEEELLYNKVYINQYGG
ncbi:MAG: hypothetical protein PWP27_1077 [Clostridiales bacterium]|jgi:nitroreductase|nr:hypothetical protein [Clostridiales bacterium]MDK2933267.1 hypothetical protein [Clostridiales bacterium]